MSTQPAEGDPAICLCLSGGGFRATLFHLGAVIRLNELGVLARLSTVVSVSGGSILNGVLATRWSNLRLGPSGTFTNFADEVVDPVRRFCSADLRTPILLGTRLNPLRWPALVRDGFSVSANLLATGYEPLYRARLGDLPVPGRAMPRFVFCATNVRTGACWHFHGGPEARMGDFYAGYCGATSVRVSESVAASSAFPPGFSALRLTLPQGCAFSRVDPWGETQKVSAKRGGELHQPAGRPILLTDGGVYDNLGVEPVWKRPHTMLVSDAGRPFGSVPRSRQTIIARLKRAVDISMEQVGAVRKRWLIEDLKQNRRDGAFWSLHTLLDDFNLADRCGYGPSATRSLHRVRTDLNAFTEAEFGCLVNHGYSIADASVRTYAAACCSNSGATFRWPHQHWQDETRLLNALRTSHKRRLMGDSLRYLTRRPSC